MRLTARGFSLYNNRMTVLPEKFTERMRRELGENFPDFIASYELPPVRGLRVNTLRIPAEEFVSVCPWELSPSGVLEEGFVVSGAENVGRHPYHAAGLFYMQEPTAMSAAAASLADDSGLRVLDMCAAPGGKTGGVAARMRGKGVIVANEIVPKRARLLAQNIERLGIPNAAVTNAHPDAVSAEFPRFFDIVMVDAPCSGEGMFRKDPTAAAEWSPEHVAACAERQKLIMDSSAPCVRPGGALVYSTCTFSREENEGVIEHFLERHGDFSIEYSERFYPHTSRGEGHFVCRLRRVDAAFAPHYPTVRTNAGKASSGLVGSFFDGVQKNSPPEGVLYEKNGVVRLIPRDMPEGVLKLHPVSVGVELGEIRKGRFEPSHSYFMAALGQDFTRRLTLQPGSAELSAFLSGNTVPCPADMRGWTAVGVNAGSGFFPVGFGKAVDGVMKNHLPKGLYIN